MLHLILLAALASQSPDPQSELLAAARELALSYTQTLPNFTCDQETDRYIRKKSTANWNRRDRITTRLSYDGKYEDYQLIAINGRPVKGMKLEAVGGTISKGDFASALRFIFSPASDAAFEWESTGTMRGRACEVFHYQVDQAHSRLRITEGVTGHYYQSAYGGIVYIDKETKQTLRLTIETSGIPEKFPVQATTQQLDYDWATIAGEKYFLPFESDVRMTHGKELTRNVSRYENYRKFTADATVTFH